MVLKETFSWFVIKMRKFLSPLVLHITKTTTSLRDPFQSLSRSLNEKVRLETSHPYLVLNLMYMIFLKQKEKCLRNLFSRDKFVRKYPSPFAPVVDI